MFINLTSVLVACTMVSCVSIASSDETKRPNVGDDFPLTQADGSQGSWDDSDDQGSERWQDIVSREPMWMINAGNGMRNSNQFAEDNARGLAVWWRGDHAVDELVLRIRGGYNLGARWFFINRPMGTPGNTFVPGASWLTLDDAKRDKLPELLTQAMLDEFEEPVHIVWFVGSDMSDPRSFPGWTPSRSNEFYQLGRDETWEQVIGSRVTLGGWISTGASGIGIDNSSPIHKRAHYLRLFKKLVGFPFHLTIYGEAFPLEYNPDGRVSRDLNGTPRLNQEYVESMPWIGATRYMETRWPIGVDSDSFPLDPQKTRMFVWFDRISTLYGSEADRRDLVNEYMDRGLIPITADPVMFIEALDRYHASQPSNAAASDDGASTQRGSSTHSARPKRVRKHTGPRQAIPKRYQFRN